MNRQQFFLKLPLLLCQGTGQGDPPPHIGDHTKGYQAIQLPYRMEHFCSRKTITDAQVEQQMYRHDKGKIMKSFTVKFSLDTSRL